MFPLPERASSDGAQANVNYVDGEYGEEGDEREEGKIANVVNAAEEEPKPLKRKRKDADDEERRHHSYRELDDFRARGKGLGLRAAVCATRR